jgi:hypothetical protein
VTALTDGNVALPQVVVNGAITPVNPQIDPLTNLPIPYTSCVAGLPYSPQFQSLPLNPPTQGAETSQGKRIKVSAVTVRMQDSRGARVGPNFANMLPFKERTPNTPMGVPLPLVTGDQRLIVEEDWTTFNQICVDQPYPLPVTILGLYPEVNVGDN